MAELDRTILSKPFAARRLKLYHYRYANEPIVRFDWKRNTDVEIPDSDDEDSEISEKGNFGTDNISRVAVNRAKKDTQPRIPRPWELRGKDADEHWQRVYQDVISGKMKKRADTGRLAPWEEELIRWTENDAQFWNYKDDYKDMKLDEIPRFKTPLLRPQLFIWKEGNEWLPPGKLKFACAETSLSVVHHVEPTLTLGEPAIELLSRNILETIECKMSPPTTDIIYDEYLYRESSNVTIDAPRISQHLEIFECSMGNYGREDNHRGRQRSRSADSHDERQQYSRNYFPVQYNKPSPPRREFYREYQSYRPDRDNSPYHRYPKCHDNFPINRSSSPRVHAYEDGSQDGRDSSCYTSDKKLLKKETICETSTSTTSTVTDLPSPFVTMSDNHIESLKQISTTLQSTLETTNRVYRAAMDEFPNMETTFALMRNGVQGLATQLVDINRSFRVSGQQLQSQSDALNTAVMTLTEDIDKLRVLVRNI